MLPDFSNIFYFTWVWGSFDRLTYNFNTAKKKYSVKASADSKLLVEFENHSHGVSDVGEEWWIDECCKLLDGIADITQFQNIYKPLYVGVKSNRTKYSSRYQLKRKLKLYLVERVYAVSKEVLKFKKQISMRTMFSFNTYTVN